MIFPILEARAEIKKKCFRSFFGSNENFKICFSDLLTFKEGSFSIYYDENRGIYGPCIPFAYLHKLDAMSASFKRNSFSEALRGHPRQL